MKKRIFEVQREPFTDINEMLADAVDNTNLSRDKGVIYYNVGAAFDIETTSYEKENGEKVGIMYHWQLCINGRVILGRTWEEWQSVYNKICELMGLGKKKRLIIYVHNLSFEFQFLAHRHNWADVFAIDDRRPVYARTVEGVEYRCSYLLTGKSLARLAKDVILYDVRKEIGDLDYSLLRGSNTPLTEKERGYCISDVMVVAAYIDEQIRKERKITNIPLTKTGYIRRYCRENTLYKAKRLYNYDYKGKTDNLKITDLTEFELLSKAFQGGFTHANACYVGHVLNNVSSYDFTSSYPAVMLYEKFPMSKGVRVHPQTQQEFEQYINKYCCIIKLRLHNVLTRGYEHILSSSRCSKIVGGIYDNGRLVGADLVDTVITSEDYKALRVFYTCKSFELGDMIVYKKEYLPRELIMCIIKLYEQKTQLKGVAGREADYLFSKELLNSCYGMCVTSPFRDEYIFTNCWEKKEKQRADLLTQLHKYNDSKRRFLFYPWGVWVAAYARRNLFTAIRAVGIDYVYSDTDSIKLLHGDKHKAYFEQYNNMVVRKLRNMCEHYEIPFERVAPRTIEGKQKIIGLWDFEGVYDRFKTLGAKRYMTERDGKVAITVAGVNKNTAIPYLLNTYGNDVFNAFNDGLYIPKGACGKKVHSYIDYEVSGEMTDYLGNVCKFDELSSVHLAETWYTLNIPKMYLEYLNGLRYRDI